MRIIVINGPNLNMLGIREKQIYGTQSYEDLLTYISTFCEPRGISVDYFQSNHEGELIDRIQACYNEYDGIVINPGGYTMTSAALLDTILAVGIPTVEVHISDMDNREEFRKRSYIGQACIKIISGHGFRGYTEAIEEIRTHCIDVSEIRNRFIRELSGKKESVPRAYPQHQTR